MCKLNLSFVCLAFFVLLMHQLVVINAAPTGNRNTISISLNRTKHGVTRISNSQRWSNGIVPYTLSSELRNQQCLIETAMMYIMLKTCIFFRPRQPDDHSSVRIHLGNGCSASVGQSQNGQISLAEGCHYPSIVLHELMHTLGFDHEQMRSNRDAHIKINYDNIEDYSIRPNFEKNHPYHERTWGEFDFDSIMLYGDTGFSTSWTKVTIEPKIPGKRLVKANRLSQLDVKSINALYQCGLVDNRACDKIDILNRLVPNCFSDASNVLHWSIIEPVKRQCQDLRK